MLIINLLEIMGFLGKAYTRFKPDSQQIGFKPVTIVLEKQKP